MPPPQAMEPRLAGSHDLALNPMPRLGYPYYYPYPTYSYPDDYSYTEDYSNSYVYSNPFPYVYSNP